MTFNVVFSWQVKSWEVSERESVLSAVLFYHT